MEHIRKKRIALEILLFFGAILLVLFFLLSLTLWNTYHHYTNSNISKGILTLKTNIDSLHMDRIGELYKNVIHNKLVVYYKVDEDVGYVRKVKEKDFLIDYPEAKKLPAELKRYSLNKDSTYDFDFVDINEFRSLLFDSTYCNIILNHAFYWELGIPSPPKGFQLFDIKDLKKINDYKQKIMKDLQSNKIIIEKVGKLTKKLNDQEDKLKLNKQHIISDNNVFKYSIFLLISIFILLYPIRLMFKMLKWSIDEIKR